MPRCERELVARPRDLTSRVFMIGLHTGVHAGGISVGPGSCRAYRPVDPTVPATAMRGVASITQERAIFMVWGARVAGARRNIRKIRCLLRAPFALLIAFKWVSNVYQAADLPT
jgi:hypothetical protein